MIEQSPLKRRNFILSEKEFQQLRKIAFDLHISMSEVVRQGIALVIKQTKDTKK